MDKIEKILFTITISLAILVNFKLLYGLAYYIIIIIVCLFILVIYFSSRKYSISHKTWIYETLYGTPVVYIIIVSFATWLIFGAIVGFGINIMVVSVPQYVLYFTSYILIAITIEVIRRILIDYITTGKYLYIVIVSIPITILYLILQNMGFSTMISLLSAIIFLLYNIFLSTLAFKYGFKTQLSTALTYTFLFKISPLMPNLPTKIEYMYKGFILLIATITLYMYYWRTTHPIQETFLEKPSLKKKIMKILNIASTITLIILIIGFLMGYRGLVVASGSMSPVLEIGDVVIVDTINHNVKVGDIIVFVVEKNIVIHRVINKYALNTENIYLTKGDANREPDPWVVYDKQIIGKYVAKIPYIGYPTLLYSQLINDKVLGIGVIIVFILLFTILYLTRDVVLG